MEEEDDDDDMDDDDDEVRLKNGVCGRGREGGCLLFHIYMSFIPLLWYYCMIPDGRPIQWFGMESSDTIVRYGDLR